MNEITIRMATMDDYDAICHLTEQVDQLHTDLIPAVFQPFSGPARSQERIAHFVEGSNADIIVASLDDNILGYLNIQKAAHPPYPMFRTHEFAQVENLVVDAGHRQQGVGIILLAAAKEWSRDRGLRFIQTNVWSANRHAREFYGKHGFETITERIELDLNDEDT